ncbi:MAG: hypothetical protein DRJ59_01730, partial [Thermoprotei archaeon]
MPLFLDLIKNPIGLLVYLLVFPGLIFIFIISLVFEWYKRKLIARMQSRLGPTYTGSRGILQPLADFIKLLFKEDIRVDHADHAVVDFVIIFAPALLIACTVIFIPWYGRSLYSFEGDALLLVLLLSLSSILVYLIGWSVQSPFTKLGSLRLVLQVAGFDIASMLLLSVPVLETGSLSIEGIASRLPGVLVRKPIYILPHFIAFVLFLLSQQAEMEEDPFDIPHAETEIVAGHITEISGRRLAFLDLFKDTQMTLVGLFAASLYFGVPFPGATNPPLWIANALCLVLEAALVLFILYSIEAATARIRIHDL